MIEALTDFALDSAPGAEIESREGGGGEKKRHLVSSIFLKYSQL